MCRLFFRQHPTRTELARYFVVGLFLVAIAAPCGADEPDDLDPFEKLNVAFRSAYSEARTELLDAAGPVVMSKGDYLLLFYRGERLEGERVDEAYHQLKTVAHVPLALYVMLVHDQNSPLSDRDLEELQAYRELVEPVRQAIQACGLTECQRKRQRQLLDRCLAFIDKVIADRQCSRYALAQFCSSCTPALMKNVYEATHVRLDAYHRQMQAWQKHIKPDDWRGLRVVVVGPQMPRPGNLSVQYFARLMRETGVRERIVYAEALFDEEKALNLLATHQLDGAAAQVFFNDPRRLHRDLLSDATATALETLDWTQFRGLGEAE